MVSLDICNIVASPCCKVHAARLVHHDDLITLRPDDGAETCHLTLARWTARFVAEITRFQALANSPSLLFVPPPSLSLSFFSSSLQCYCLLFDIRYFQISSWSSSTVAAAFCAPSIVYDRNDPIRVHFSRTPYEAPRCSIQTTKRRGSIAVIWLWNTRNSLSLPSSPSSLPSSLSCLIRVFTSVHCFYEKTRFFLRAKAIAQDCVE